MRKLDAMRKVCQIMENRMPKEEDALWLEQEINRLSPSQQVAVRARMEWERAGRQPTKEYDIVDFVTEKLRDARLPYDKNSVDNARFTSVNTLFDEYARTHE